MKNNYKKVISRVLSIVMVLTMVVGNLCANTIDLSNKKDIVIYLVGDSTVCQYGDDSKNYDVQRAGWGEKLGYYFGDHVKVENLALSGRSARSFTYEKNYQILKDSIQAGDYLFIQFGHNDAKEDDLTATETSKLYKHSSPVQDETVEGSYRYYLTQYYINLAKEKGAIPVLVTPIVRRKFIDNKVSDSHYSAVKGEDTVSYDDAVRALAKKLNVALIDLNTATTDLYNTIGEEVSISMHAFYNASKGSKVDNTHLNDYGANIVAGLVVDGIKASDLALKNEIIEQNTSIPTIYLVGDSTVCNYGDDTKNYRVERSGWGENLNNYFNENEVNVINLALSGRSSRSFTYEDQYKALQENLKAGDYLFIQFGHNDEKEDDLTSTETSKCYRHTSPIGDETVEGSFANVLYVNYIKLAEEKGAIPVLITPIVRRSYNEEGTIKESHYSALESEKAISYNEVIRTLAHKLDITLIDLNEKTATLYNTLGKDGTVYLHAIYNEGKGIKVDNTHLSDFGSNIVAKMVAEGILESNLQLKDYVLVDYQYNN